MILIHENQYISVFTTPQKLREIADVLEEQQKRFDQYKGGKLQKDTDTLCSSLSCQISHGPTTIHFRLPLEAMEYLSASKTPSHAEGMR